jgi:hypothetical protein
MRANRRISYTLVFLLILLMLACLSAAQINPPPENNAASFSSINFVSNIETIGVSVSGTGLPEEGELYYRQSGEGSWRSGHPLMRIDDGRLVGSLFGLLPATSYDVKAVAGSAEIVGSVSTQPDLLTFTPTVILHVDDDVLLSGDGSAAAPYKTIQEAVNHAGPGTQVLVANGIYREAVTFPGSGTEGNWIQVKAEGSGAVLDSADRLSGKIWTLTSTSKVWFTKINGPVAYLARSGTRFYQYDDLNGLKQAKGHGGVAINEGWFYEAATSRLYIRSLDDPAAHLWQLPRLNHAFDVSARDWLWIEGFEIRFYGTTTNGCGVCTLNSSHLVIRRNEIHNMQLGIFVNWNGSSTQGNDTRVEGNEIYDPGIYDWPWAALKASYMEGTGIIVRGHIGAIVRDNTVHSYFNGIYVGSSGALENSELAFDADIYQNHMYNISDDGLEPEGACINQRFRNNSVDKSFIGLSVAPVTQGPTWVLRNTFTGYTGRAIKFADDSDGIVLIYHNTAWTAVSNINGADLITAVHHVKMRNNIFQSTGYSIYEVPTGSTANDWNYDDWYTTKGTAGSHFKWENVNYNTISALCKASGLECNGSESAPGFANPAGGDFTLLASSPNIDRGIPISGINDGFSGSAPDAGAYETATVSIPPVVLSITRLNANPTSAASVDYELSFSKPVSGVDLLPPFADFKVSPGFEVTGAAVTGVTAISDSIYKVSVNTGTGNGSLRLDIVDDDSIIDAEGNPLGGTGAGNGDFNAGETYTINRSITVLITAGFNSVPAYDGWVLESGENTNAGGTLDKGASTFNAGDDPRDRQYRGILSFNTSSLPDNAVIVSAQVKVKRQGVVGTDPFVTHGLLLVEMRSGSFSNNIALQKGDFSASATPGSIRDQFTALTYSWYAAQLSDANLPFVSKSGSTQFRLSFSRDDNDDQSADYMKFYSGNSTSANVPQLIVSYYLP